MNIKNANISIKALSVVTSLILAVTLCFTGSGMLPLSAGAAATNLLTDGNAETGKDGWIHTKSSENANALRAMSNITETSTMAVSHRTGEVGGEHYFLSWSYNHIYQVVTLKAGNIYKLSLDYYPGSGDAAVAVFGGTDVNDTGNNLLLNNNLPAETKWLHAEYTFACETDGEYVIRIFSGSGSDFGFDNASLEQPEAYVINGDAETGSRTGWSTYPDDYNSLRSVDNEGATGGQKCFVSFSYRTHYQSVALTGGKTYRLTMNYKNQCSNAAVFMTAGSGNYSGDRWANNVLPYSGGNWKKCSYLLTPAAGGIHTLGIYSGTNGDFYFDDVKLEEVSLDYPLYNGDFTDGAVGWTLGGSSGVYTKNDSNVMNVAWGQTVSQQVVLKKGGVYRLSFSHGPGGGGNVTNSIRAAVTGENEQHSVTASGYNTSVLYFEAQQDSVQTVSFTSSGSNYDLFNVVLELIDSSMNDGIIACVETKTINDAGKPGCRSLRFTDILKTTDSSGTAVSVNGTEYTIVRRGILFAAQKYAENGKLTLEEAETDGMIVVKEFDTFDSNDGNIQVFTGLIDNIDDAHAETVFVSRGYIVAKDAQGNSAVFYSGISAGSIV